MPAWTAKKVGGTLVVRADDAQLIADVLTNENDARVLAAAPDLLTACELLLCVPNIDVEAPNAVEIARDAVAKAKGG